jgi:hypothetical protein
MTFDDFINPNLYIVNSLPLATGRKAIFPHREETGKGVNNKNFDN